MDLYIQIKDGIPFEHPIPDWNMKMFFSDLNPNNPPEGYARFVRLPYPLLEEYKVVDSIDYVLSEEYTKLYGTPTYTDLYRIRDMTQEEIDSLKPVEPSPEVPDDDEEEHYFFAEGINKWINYAVFEKVFTDFFIKYNLKFEDIDLTDYKGFDEKQKEEFLQLIAEYDELTKDKDVNILPSF
jgi:hypothetical protein